MDNHLNLFYSYGQGSTKRVDSSIQLEDNLTRAFIVLLKNLNIKLQKEILKKIIPENIQYTIQSKEFSYDLQNTTQQRKGKKFLIVIQRYINNDLQTLDTKNTIIPINEFKEDNNNLKELKSCIINGTDFRFNGITYPNNELLSLYEIVHDNRPDGWILGDKETFLIETKIGNNSVSRQQIFRHITQGNGYNCNNIDDVEIIQLEWQSLYKIISDIETSNAKYDFLLKQFKEYLEMTGQVLNLNYILEGNINPEQHKEQFELFINLFNKHLSKEKFNLELNNRNLDGLWVSFVSRGEQNLRSHYTLAFWEDCLCIYLTIPKGRRLIYSIIENNNLYYVISNIIKDDSYLQGHYLSLNKYNLVDWKGGQIRGEKYSPYNFEIRFNELKLRINGNNNIQFNDILLSTAKYFDYKQFEIGLKIDLFDFEKIRISDEEQIRTQNKKLIEDPEELAKLFINFIEKSWDLFEYLNNSNTSPSPQTPIGTLSGES